MAQAAQLDRDSEEIPPIKNDDKYKVMPDLSEEEYKALKRDIAENGVKVEVVIGVEEGRVIDGHHRLDACNELGIEDYPIRTFSGAESEKYSFAWSLNMQRRHFSQGEKKERIKDRLLQLDERGEHKDDREIAQELGVSGRWVGKIKEKLLENGKIRSNSNLTTQSEKRKQIEAAIQESPEKSNRQIARDLNIKTSHPTVSKVRKEMEEEPEEKKAEVEKSDETEKTTVEIRGRGDEDWSKIKDLIELAESGNETARKELEKVSEGEKTVSKAYKKVQKEKKKEEAEKKDQEIEEIETVTDAIIRKQDYQEFLNSISDHSIDLLLTDPPYMTDLEDVHSFAKKWVPQALKKIRKSGRAYICTGSYPEELHAYLDVVRRELEDSEFEIGNILVWTYQNTLGPAPNKVYKQNWQAIFYIYGSDAPDIDSPKLLEQFTVQRISAPDGRQGNRYHKWQKPLKLAGRLIRHSTVEGDSVIDPFAGTGTFLLAAAKLGRQGLGCEIDDKMIEIAKKRGCSIDQ